MPARARLAVLGAWLWCASTCCGGLRPGTAPWVRLPPMRRLRGGAEPPSSSRKAFGIDSYVASELRKFGLLPSSAWADSDADDFERDEEEASRRRDAAAKMPVNTSAEEAYAWHEAYDRAQEEARQYRYKHAEEIERQEWEQAEKDAEEETSCCGYGRFSGLSARFNGTTHRDPGMFRPNETDQDFWRRYGEGHLTNRTLKGLYDLKLAASFNDCEEIQRLVEDDGVDPAGLCDEISAEQAIHYAAYSGHIDACMQLLDMGVDVNARNCRLQTPLHRAAFGGFQELCELLVERGADALARDSFEFTPPEWASYSEHNQTCQWFYAKFIHNGGGSPLQDAPMYGLPPNTGNIFFDPFERNDDNNVSLGFFNRAGGENNMDHSLSEKGLVRAMQLENLRSLQSFQADRRKGGSV